MLLRPNNDTICFLVSAERTSLLITRHRYRLNEHCQRSPGFLPIIRSIWKRKKRALSTDVVDSTAITLPERVWKDLSSKNRHLYFNCFTELELGELPPVLTWTTQSKIPGVNCGKWSRFDLVSHPSDLLDLWAGTAQADTAKMARDAMRFSP